MEDLSSTKTALQDFALGIRLFHEDPQARLHLNDPIPHEGWLPSEEQIRRFCEQLRAEPGW